VLIFDEPVNGLDPDGMAVLIVLPGIAQALPDSCRNPVTEFWPTRAGSQLTGVHHSARTLQPWPGFGVMCLFGATVDAIAGTLLDRRDAWWRPGRTATPATPAPAAGSDQ
jgi:hypothetical protein